MNAKLVQFLFLVNMIFGFFVYFFNYVKTQVVGKKMKPTGTDPRILSLAAEVAKSPEQNVPVILLKLKGKKIFL